MAARTTDAGRVRPGEAPPAAPVSAASLDAFARDVATLPASGVTDRAQAFRMLQRSVGNRAVGAMLMRSGVPAHVKAEPTWTLTVKPGGVGVGRTRDLGEPAKLFRGDTLIVTATWKSLKETEQGMLELKARDARGLDDPHGGWSTKNSYQWTIQMMSMGHHHLQFWSTAEGMLTASRDVSVYIVTDVIDLGLRASAATDIAKKKFDKAVEAIGLASAAWTSAYNRHEKVLKDADAQEKLNDELLMGLFLAALGGGMGGALGGWLKNVASLKALGDRKQTVPDVIVGGITDAAKDTLKYTVRSTRKLKGSGPETAGDSSAAPATPQGGTGNAVPLDKHPGVFLGKLMAQLGHESALVSAELANLKLAASDARAALSVAEFDQDPVGLVEADTKLEMVTKGLKTDDKDYLTQLWGAWLNKYAFKIGSGPSLHIDREPYTDEEIPQFKVRDNISGSLRAALREEAKYCGTTLEAWMTTYTTALRERLEAEAKKQSTDEWNRYWAEKQEEERKRREASEAMWDSD